ncbi:MAG: NTP transferase domain-containing protein [Clostridia bacterium]
MRALLLNSGMGHRMGELTRRQPKCMTPIGQGYTILSHQLEQICKAGIPEVLITTGPFANPLQAYVEGLALPLRVSFIHNPDYAKTNYIYSMHLAAPLLRGQDVCLFHGDLVLENSVLSALLAAKASVMAVDSTLPLPEKDFKAKLQNGKIIAVGVDHFGADCVACQPAYKWLAADWERWMNAIAAFVKAGNVGVYAENAFNAQNGAIPLHPLEMHGKLCNEIDNSQDLEAVSRRFQSLFVSHQP